VVIDDYLKLSKYPIEDNKASYLLSVLTIGIS